MLQRKVSVVWGGLRDGVDGQLLAFGGARAVNTPKYPTGCTST